MSMNKKELFGASRPTIVQPITPIISPPVKPITPPVTHKETPSTAQASTYTSNQKKTTREELLKMATEMQTAVLGLESVEKNQKENDKLKSQLEKLDYERQRLDKLAKKYCQTMIEKDEQLKVSQREAAKVSRELNQLQAAEEAIEGVHNSQLATYKDQVERLSVANVGLENQNKQLEEQLVSVTRQLEDQLGRPEIVIEPNSQDLEASRQTWAQEKLQLEEQV